MNSDEIVECLERYGCVSIHQYGVDKTWSAKARLFTHGCQTEVRSGFNHPTMLAALSSVWDKVRKLVNVETAAGKIESHLRGEREDG